SAGRATERRMHLPRVGRGPGRVRGSDSPRPRRAGRNVGPAVMGVVFLYAALLAVIFVALSVRTLLLRRRLGIAIGDGDDARMLRAMRAHANFAEYVPLSLLLFFFAEVAGASALLLHALGASLLAGRL